MPDAVGVPHVERVLMQNDGLLYVSPFYRDAIGPLLFACGCCGSPLGAVEAASVGGTVCRACDAVVHTIQYERAALLFSLDAARAWDNLQTAPLSRECIESAIAEQRRLMTSPRTIQWSYLMDPNDWSPRVRVRDDAESVIPDDTITELVALAKAGNREDFDFLAGACGVEDREALWNGTRARLNLPEVAHP